MYNLIPNSNPRLFAICEDAADGARQHGTQIGLKQNTAEAIGADLLAARSAETDFSKSKAEKEKLGTALRIADSNGRAFIKAASAYFSQVLSENWSAEWEPTGFPNQSTAIPDTQEERFTLLESLKTYFADNASMEISTGRLILTAARAGALHEALSSARAAVNNGNSESGRRKMARDAAVDALKTRLRGLIGELGQLLPDDSPLWEAFGLNAPGADATPESPEALVVTPGLPGQFHADWGDSRGATRYRVWVLIVGMDENFRAVATVSDSDATITGLPTGKTVKVRVTAANDAGESAPSAEVEAQIP